jgi:hypothetical protein
MIKWTTVVFMSAAAVAALIAIIMPAVANAGAPSKSDTIQTWTCRWKGAVGAPENFGPLCRESVCCSFLLCLRSSSPHTLLPECTFLFALVMFTDMRSSNSPLTLLSHSSSFTFCSWSRVSRMPLLYLSLSRHTMRSWSLLPRVSMSLLQVRTIAHESSKSTKDQGMIVRGLFIPIRE